MTIIAPHKRQLQLAKPQVKDLATIMRSLTDKNRLQILALLTKGELCVCELVDVLNLPQNLISHHLSILRRNGLVRARHDSQDTRWVYYSINQRALTELQASLFKLFDLSQMDSTPADCGPNSAK